MATQASPRVRKRAKVIRTLRNRYRLLLINDSTFEERFSVRLSKLNVLLLGVLTFTLYGALITAVIVFTPLKRYIPGYSDQTTKMHAFRNTMLADSLETRLQVTERYVQNIRAVLQGDIPTDSTHLLVPSEIRPELADLQPNAADSALRAKLAVEEAYVLAEGGRTERMELAGIFFFTPVRGIVTTSFDRVQGHYGIDIVTKTDETVKACLDGTVTMASWTTDAGHVVQLQHRNDLVSIYKHNSVLLKRVGDRVKAGEAIAMVGNSGELTTGPHLHFELWSNGEPVDPRVYMVFE